MKEEEIKNIENWLLKSGWVVTEIKEENGGIMVKAIENNCTKCTKN